MSFPGGMQSWYPNHSGTSASRATMFTWVGEPTGFAQHKIFYSAVLFKWTNAVVRIGDDVTLQFENHMSSLPAVARIETLWFDSARGVGCLTVRWFYRVQDVPPQLMNRFPLGTPGRNEIFLSEAQGNFDIQSVVIGRASVVRADSDAGLLPHEYLSRVTFSPERLIFGSLMTPLLPECSVTPSQSLTLVSGCRAHGVPSVPNMGIDSRMPQSSSDTMNALPSTINVKHLMPRDESLHSLREYGTQSLQQTSQDNSAGGHIAPPRFSQHAIQRESAPQASVPRNRHCTAEDCKRQPSFGYDGQPAKFCARHKVEGMTNVVSRRCDAADCKRQPIYGIQGEKRPRFCSAHKSLGMIDIKNRRCEANGCSTHPTYGFPGQKRRFCGAHKKEGMMDFKSSRCNMLGCLRRPSYALPSKRASRCSGHKESGMVDVKHRQCDAPQCSKRVESRRRLSSADSRAPNLQSEPGSSPIPIYCAIHQDLAFPAPCDKPSSPSNPVFNANIALPLDSISEAQSTARTLSPIKFPDESSDTAFQADRAPLGSVSSPHSHRRTIT